MSSGTWCLGCEGRTNSVYAVGRVESSRSGGRRVACAYTEPDSSISTARYLACTTQVRSISEMCHCTPYVVAPEALWRWCGEITGPGAGDWETP